MHASTIRLVGGLALGQRVSIEKSLAVSGQSGGYASN